MNSNYYNNDNDNNNDKQQFIFYYCRQLKEYDNDNKMVIWKKENSYTRKLRKNNLSSR